MNDLKKIADQADNKKEEAASLVEYVLLVALIAIICIAAITLVGQSASSKFSDVASALQ